MRLLFKAKVMDALGATAARATAVIGLAEASHGSFQVQWDGLVTPGGTFQVQQRNDPAARWVNVSGASRLIATSDGEDIINLNDVTSGYQYQLIWTPASESAGSVSSWAIGKGT